MCDYLVKTLKEELSHKGIGYSLIRRLKPNGLRLKNSPKARPKGDYKLLIVHSQKPQYKLMISDIQWKVLKIL